MVEAEKKINKGISFTGSYLIWILIVEFLTIASLVIALIVVNVNRQSSGIILQPNDTSKISCDKTEYDAFDERVFYGAWLDKEHIKKYLQFISDKLAEEYQDPDLKVAINDVQSSTDDTVIRGYQIVNGIIIEDTFFAIFSDKDGLLEELPLFMNPGKIDANNLISPDEAEGIAYPAIVRSSEEKHEKLSDSCGYQLTYSEGLGYYYDFSFGRSYVYIDAKNGNILDTYIHPSIIH